ncbi:hypothetical protein Axi01nite_25050 [Actinoplanes xinjiangensis]|nr:hypothetical protein Axi01nite_25050 [Actinoplanes xinjiangensis]
MLGETCGANGMGAAWASGRGGVGSMARGRRDRTAVARRESVGRPGGYGARLPAFPASRPTSRSACRPDANDLSGWSWALSQAS